MYTVAHRDTRFSSPRRAAPRRRYRRHRDVSGRTLVYVRVCVCVCVRYTHTLCGATREPCMRDAARASLLCALTRVCVIRLPGVRDRAYAKEKAEKRGGKGEKRKAPCFCVEQYRTQVHFDGRTSRADKRPHSSSAIYIAKFT